MAQDKCTAHLPLPQQTLTRTEALKQVNEELRKTIEDGKQAKAALQESERRFRLAVNHFPSMFVIYDAERRIIFANAHSLQISGYQEHEILGKRDEDLFPPEVTAAYLPLLQKAVATQTAQSSELTMSLGGLTYTVIVNYVPLFDEEGNSYQILGVFHDISEQKRAEEIQRRQVERERLVSAIAHRIRQTLNLDDILNTTVAEVQQFLRADRVLLYQVFPDGTGTVVTEALAEGCLGIVSRTLPEEIFPQSCHERFRQGYIRAVNDVETDEMAPCLVEVLRQLGVQAKLVVPVLQGHNLWGLLVAHQCATTRQWQQSEVDLLQQLATQLGIAIQQSELYRAVQQLNLELEQQVQDRTTQLQLAFDFEATLKRITDKVRDSLDERQILQTAVRELAIAIGAYGCNAALYNLERGTSTVCYEYSTKTSPFQGRIMQMANFSEGYQQLLSGYEFQFCSLMPNPSRGQVAMLACPILDDQGVLGDLWLVNHASCIFSEQDIRLMQQVANQCAIAIRQAQLYHAAQVQVEELERLNRLKDDFLSTVSHELRTPMSSIKMAIQMLEIALKQIGVLKEEVDSVTRYFQILRHECQREINLINDLLDLSRLDSKAEPPILTAINLQSWMERVAAPFQENARNQQQQFQVELPSALPPLTTNPADLERIVTELLHNACKYTPPGEKIWISARPTAGGIQISVSNSGVEIASSEIPRIFERFYRIPKGDPWQHSGTGLGLALVKKLTERLGATIQVDSSDSQTRFTIHLPNKVATVGLGVQ